MISFIIFFSYENNFRYFFDASFRSFGSCDVAANLVATHLRVLERLQCPDEADWRFFRSGLVAQVGGAEAMFRAVAEEGSEETRTRAPKDGGKVGRWRQPRRGVSPEVQSKVARQRVRSVEAAIIRRPDMSRFGFVEEVSCCRQMVCVGGASGSIDKVRRVSGKSQEAPPRSRRCSTTFCGRNRGSRGSVVSIEASGEPPTSSCGTAARLGCTTPNMQQMVNMKVAGAPKERDAVRNSQEASDRVQRCPPPPPLLPTLSLHPMRKLIPAEMQNWSQSCNAELQQRHVRRRRETSIEVTTKIQEGLRRLAEMMDVDLRGRNARTDDHVWSVNRNARSRRCNLDAVQKSQSTGSFLSVRTGESTRRICILRRWQGDAYRHVHCKNQGSSRLNDASDILFLTLFEGDADNGNEMLVCWELLS